MVQHGKTADAALSVSLELTGMIGRCTAKKVPMPLMSLIA